MVGHISHNAGDDAGLLGIYLNDHLAGATGGAELARRMASVQRSSPAGAPLRQLARDIGEDRAALISIMRTLGVPVRRYKAGLGWIGEKVGRLKLNGHLLSRSPLSSLEELELLRLGAEGKAAGWRTLRSLADTDQRVDARQVDELLNRARSQVDVLENLRVTAASELIAGQRRRLAGINAE